MILAHAAGAEATCWFSAQDTVDGPMGLQDNTGRKRPAYAAYLELAKNLGNARYLCESGGNTASSGLREFLFQDDESYIVASWPSPAASASVESVRYERRVEAPQCRADIGSAGALVQMLLNRKTGR